MSGHRSDSIMFEIVLCAWRVQCFAADDAPVSHYRFAITRSKRSSTKTEPKDALSAAKPNSNFQSPLVAEHSHILLKQPPTISVHPVSLPTITLAVILLVNHMRKLVLFSDFSTRSLYQLFNIKTPFPLLFLPPDSTRNIRQARRSLNVY